MALASTEDGFERAFRAVPDPLVLMDPGTERIVDCNSRAADFLGYDREELTGCELADIHPNDARRVRAALSGAATDGGRVRERATCHRKDGTAVAAEISGSALELDGRTYHLVTIHPRERRQSRVSEVEEELERLRLLVDEFAHDVTSPLSTALLRVEGATETGTTDELDVACDSLRRIQRMVDELRESSRSLGDEDGTGGTEPVLLGAVADDAWTQADTAGATLSVVGHRQFEADREMVVRLLVNLFENAVEHGSTSPDSGARQDAVGSVNVRVGPTDAGFFVADDGPGLPDETETIFQPRRSVGSSGSGLGLAVVSRLAGAHGWQVEAGESESGGARFEVTGVEEPG